eukprot:6777178-Ditylum_brightwellii.AAC.1
MEFGLFIEETVRQGFLLPEDILVADNAKIYLYDTNWDLEKFLMDYKYPITGTPMKIRAVKLPTRSPNFNPIEPLWALLVKELEDTADWYTGPIQKQRDVTA